MTATLTEPGPVVEQLVAQRLAAVLDHMRLVLETAAGSSAEADGPELAVSLHLPDGRLAVNGFQHPGKAVSASLLIKHLRGSAEVHPGDVFVANDPFVCAVDQRDLYLVGPVFAGDELIAWAGAMAHQADLGGMEFGGLSPKVRECWQEGIRLPGLKLIDAGQVRDDVLALILSATRLPTSVGLDLGALIACIEEAGRHLGELAARHDAQTVHAVMERMVRHSEDRVRARLADLPDGQVRATDFLEHDGHQNRLYTVDLVVTKRGDRLRLDFSGSSSQAPGFINCTRAGLHGAVAAALLPTLGFGLCWNDGMRAPVELVAPDGLVCTARPPAPVASATVETAWVVSNVVASALNKLLACSPAWAGRAQAVSSGGMATLTVSGIDRYGERFRAQLGDPLAGGGGAWVARDGMDAGGPLGTPAAAVADVETTEQLLPVLYLYRRLAAGTGGAGRATGGRAVEVALTVAGVESADAMILSHGVEVPNAGGLFGGWPGATIRQRFGHAVLRDRAVLSGVLPGRAEAPDGGWEELGPKPGRMPMTGSDAFAVSWQGGGGWGDPLQRDPEAVWREVLDGVISDDVARRMYGVLGDGRRADLSATADLRKGIRTERIGQTVEDTPADPAADGAWPLGGSLRLVRAGREWQVRTAHGAILANGSTAWRRGAISRPIIPDRRVEGVLLHHDLSMTAFYCPVSGELLAVDVHPVGVEPMDDVLLDLESVARLTHQTRPAGGAAQDLRPRRPQPVTPVPTHTRPPAPAAAAPPAKTPDSAPVGAAQGAAPVGAAQGAPRVGAAEGSPPVGAPPGKVPGSVPVGAAEGSPPVGAPPSKEPGSAPGGAAEGSPPVGAPPSKAPGSVPGGAAEGSGPAGAAAQAPVASAPVFDRPAARSGPGSGPEAPAGPSGLGKGPEAGKHEAPGSKQAPPGRTTTSATAVTAPIPRVPAPPAAASEDAPESKDAPPRAGAHAPSATKAEDPAAPAPATPAARASAGEAAAAEAPAAGAEARAGKGPPAAGAEARAGEAPAGKAEAKPSGASAPAADAPSDGADAEGRVEPAAKDGSGSVAKEAEGKAVPAAEAPGGKEPGAVAKEAEGSGAPVAEAPAGEGSGAGAQDQGSAAAAAKAPGEDEPGAVAKEAKAPTRDGSEAQGSAPSGATSSGDDGAGGEATASADVDQKPEGEGPAGQEGERPAPSPR